MYVHTRYTCSIHYVCIIPRVYKEYIICDWDHFGNTHRVSAQGEREQLKCRQVLSKYVHVVYTHMCNYCTLHI